MYWLLGYFFLNWLVCESYQSQCIREGKPVNRKQIMVFLAAGFPLVLVGVVGSWVVLKK